MHMLPENTTGITSRYLFTWLQKGEQQFPLLLPTLPSDRGTSTSATNQRVVQYDYIESDEASKLSPLQCQGTGKDCC